ncbi:TIGR03790 family protein [Aquabacterium olei]|uniref:TIGR03790 family protein n=1 Tax=Aquabacterium olei TaxID=1296669 RepID=A0A2U8FVV4_9BURK|nr:TIGR03790 family protein [Aquabacterium olei]AWI55205.1 TIGR03790 family protein [Aquabacterium olei]
MHFSSFWRTLPCAALAALCVLTTSPSAVRAQDAAASAALRSSPAAAPSPVASRASQPARQWFKAPRVYGRLTVREVGLVINLDDPYSVQVGEYYAKARKIPEDQILRVRLPVRGELTVAEFDAFRQQVDAFFGEQTQALALAWRLPYAVGCNSLPGALALGYDAKLCSQTCAATRPSLYFGSDTTRPYTDYRVRLSMLLASRDVKGAKALIDRGVKADNTLGLKGGPTAHVHFVTTSDAIRSQRQLLFPPAGKLPQAGVEVFLDKTDALRHAERVLVYLTGRTHVDWLDTVDFLPGALGDHLTSFGGVLDRPHGQMTVLSWIDAGVTASYGTTSEPCAHLQKFPNPQALVLFYAQGATAIEAYWKSVAWPQQGLFVGEPLAAPFSRDEP